MYAFVLSVFACIARPGVFASLALRDLSYVQRPVGFDGGGWVTELVAHESTGIIYARTDVGGAYRSDDGGVHWSWLSGGMEISEPVFWETHGIAVNRSDPSANTVFVLLGNLEHSAATGVWKSVDGGKTFRHVLVNVTANSNGFTRHAAPPLTIDRGRPSRVWAAAQEGLFRSEDGGETFAPVSSFNSAPWWKPSASRSMALVSLVPPAVPSGPVDPALANHVIVGAEGVGLVFSADDGATWTQLLLGHGSPVNISSPWRVLRLPNGTSIINVDCPDGMGKTTGRVFRVTASSSAAWADVSLWHWLDITPNGTQYPGSNDIGFWGLADVVNDGTLVVASSAFESMYTSRDLGNTWTLRKAAVQPGAGPCWQPNPAVWMQSLTFGRNNIVESSRRPGVWLISTGFGVAASTDQGDSWASSSQGIGQVVTFGCHSHPTHANATFCGVADLTGFLIEDAGVSSKAASVFHDLPVYWATDFAKGAAWLGKGTGLSFAGGTQFWPSPGQWITWPAPGSPPTPTSVTWTAGSNMSGALYDVPLMFVGLLQSADDPQDLLLMTAPISGSGTYLPWNASQPATSFTGGVVRSQDGGASWHHVAQQPPTGDVGTMWSERQQMSLDGGDVDARWWALWNVGVFVSRDRGETWGEPLPYFSAAGLELVIKPDSSTATGGSGCVFAAGVFEQAASQIKPGSALLHTCDWGATWTAVGNFTASYAMPTLATHASGRIAITAAAGTDPAAVAHVWVSIDSGASWTLVDDAARGEFLSPGVSGLEFDAVDPTVLYISTGGHSVVVVKLGA